MAICSILPLNGKVNSGLVLSFGNGHVRKSSKAWIICHGADVDASESKAISVILRASAVSNVGFFGYVLHATPMTAQNRKGHCA